MYACGSWNSVRGSEKSMGTELQKLVRHIVGVQFRNQATVGGSIYGRFGFSDVLTAFLALDTFVELYDGGIIRLSEFVNRKPDRDILVSIIIRKGKRKFRLFVCPPDKDRFSCHRLRGSYRDCSRRRILVFLCGREADEGGADGEKMAA